MYPFTIDRLVAVFAPDHEFALKPQLRLADLLNEHFLGLTDAALQQHISFQAAQLGGKLKFRITLPSFDNICHMAGKGGGIGIVPESAARRCKRSSRIAITRLQDHWAMRQLSVCVREDADLTLPAKSLLKHLTKSA